MRLTPNSNSHWRWRSASRAIVLLEIRLPDEGDWSIIDVTAQNEDDLSQLKGEATEVRRNTENAAIEALRAAITERHAAGNPVTAMEAINILHAGGLTRDHARYVRDDLSVGLAAQWRRECGSDGRTWIFLPLSAAASDRSQNNTQRSTSDKPNTADAGAQYPQHSATTKSHVEDGLGNGEILRTERVNTQDRERI